jgi:hypothetical protein
MVCKTAEPQLHHLGTPKGTPLQGSTIQHGRLGCKIAQRYANINMQILQDVQASTGEPRLMNIQVMKNSYLQTLHITNKL